MNEGVKFKIKETVVLCWWESIIGYNLVGKHKLASVKSFKAGVSSVGPLSEQMEEL